MCDTTNAGPTRFAELNDLLADLVGRVQEILGDNFVGAYLIGSFALGGGDASSDCDFMVVTAEDVTEEQEAALREMHAEIPTRPGYWAINLEGSYSPRPDLESLDHLGKEWLEIDRGWREMRREVHCNVEDVRWVLRERGVVLAGPEPRTFAAEVPADLLREQMRPLIDNFLEDLKTWASFEYVWTQRYITETICRMLYTLETGEVTTKPGGMEWALRELPAAWHDLIRQTIADRSLAWNDPADPERMAAAIEFAQWAKEHAPGLPSGRPAHPAAP